MLFFLFMFLQAAASSPAVDHPSLQRKPALLSLVFMGGFALLVLLLIVSVIRNRRKISGLAATAAADLPAEVRQKLGATATNRGLRFLRWLYVLMALTVFGFHVYWAKYAQESNPRFQQLNYKDLRNGRVTDGALRGWILDRSGKIEDALAYYHADSGGKITREYSMDTAFAHLFGTDLGDPGLERALFHLEGQNQPEALAVVRGADTTQESGKDVRLTIDRDLQQEAVDQLKGRAGAVVVLNPQTGEILAMYSNPSYSTIQVRTEGEPLWIELNADKRNSPLVNRATSAYYVPGSTFKTFMMIAAMRNHQEGSIFPGTPGGYVAEPGAKPITDDNGSCEPKICGLVAMPTAFEQSSNQYFAQMAVHLGPKAIQETARLVGIGAYEDTDDLLKGRQLSDLINASNKSIQSAMAPREATMLTAPGMRPFDLALEGYGQGLAGQMTPLQMAMLAGTIANMDGNTMKLKIEYDQPPQVYNNVLTSDQAQELRRIMGLVTTAGTGRGAMAPVHAAGVLTGGKTGTAQKEIPLYDPRTGEIKMRIKEVKDPKGNIIQRYEVPMLDPVKRIDSWFLCIAPIERPVLAIAVIIEGGGYGSRAAAPVAAQMVLKAKALGLLGGPREKTPGPNAPRQPAPRTPTPRATPRPPRPGNFPFPLPL
jgi:cell division protein FtsI/penicillin-binding protein 2